MIFTYSVYYKIFRFLKWDNGHESIASTRTFSWCSSSCHPVDSWSGLVISDCWLQCLFWLPFSLLNKNWNPVLSTPQCSYSWYEKAFYIKSYCWKMKCKAWRWSDFRFYYSLISHWTIHRIKRAVFPLLWSFKQSVDCIRCRNAKSVTFMIQRRSHVIYSTFLLEILTNGSVNGLSFFICLRLCLFLLLRLWYIFYALSVWWW